MKIRLWPALHLRSCKQDDDKQHLGIPERKTSQPRILYLAEIIFKSESAVRTLFSKNQMVNEFIMPQKMLTKVLQAKGSLIDGNSDLHKEMKTCI